MGVVFGYAFAYLWGTALVTAVIAFVASREGQAVLSQVSALIAIFLSVGGFVLWRLHEHRGQLAARETHVTTEAPRSVGRSLPVSLSFLDTLERLLGGAYSACEYGFRAHTEGGVDREEVPARVMQARDEFKEALASCESQFSPEVRELLWQAAAQFTGLWSIFERLSFLTYPGDYATRYELEDKMFKRAEELYDLREKITAKFHDMRLGATPLEKHS